MQAGERDGSTARRALRGAALVVVLGAGVVACGNGGGEGDDAAPIETAGATSTSDSSETSLPACRDANRAVVFVVFGGATTGAAGEADGWVSDADASPEARPGAAALASAYRDVGYQIVYVALLPSETRIGGRPLVDAVTVWLGLNAFPVGEGVQVWAPPGDGSAGDPSVALIEELTRLGIGGTQLDTGYAGGQDTVLPLVSGGVPGDKVYLVGAGDEALPNTEVSSIPLRDEDLMSHVAEVEALEPICQ